VSGAAFNRGASRQDYGTPDEAGRAEIADLASKEDMVNYPSHYTHGEIECIEVIEDWGLSFNIGTVLRYLCRHKHKGDPIQDLEKAVWYVNREIIKLKEEENVDE